MSRKVLRFYEGVQPANDRVLYLFSDIITLWTDYKLQVRQNYINWLFPSETDTDTRLNKGLLYKFRTDKNIRLKVVKATLRMMDFFGYVIVSTNNSFETKQTKPVQREEQNVVIGLYNPENYPRITRILTFLTGIKMELLSSLFFLMLCRAMHDNPDLKHLIMTKNVLQDWIRTQPYLESRKYDAEQALFGEKLEDWERYESVEEVIIEKRDAWDE